MKQNSYESKPNPDILPMEEEIEIVLEFLEEEILLPDTSFNGNFPTVDFDIDEYFAQPPPREILPDTPEESEESDEEMAEIEFKLSPQPPQEGRRNPVRALEKYLFRAENNAFYRYLEETNDEDPYGLRRLFQLNN